MVRVPRSSEDADFHRESQEDEEVQVKIDQKTEETLEDRLPVTKEEEKHGIEELTKIWDGRST